MERTLETEMSHAQLTFQTIFSAINPSESAQHWAWHRAGFCEYLLMNERTEQQISLEGSVGQGGEPCGEGGQSFLGSRPWNDAPVGIGTRRGRKTRVNHRVSKSGEAPSSALLPWG